MIVKRMNLELGSSIGVYSIKTRTTRTTWTQLPDKPSDFCRVQFNYQQMSQLIPNTTPLRTFGDHTDVIHAVAVFPDRRRMITGSRDKTLRMWDLETGAMLTKMVGHQEMVRAFAVSRDGQFIASGGWSGELITWQGETGKLLCRTIAATNPERVLTLDFSPSGTVLATASSDRTAKLWNTKTWHWLQGNQFFCIGVVRSVRYSPDGEILAIATNGDINIINCGTRERVAKFKGHIGRNFCLAWTLNGTRLLSAGDQKDPTIREWDTSTWMQVGDPWTGHTNIVHAIAVNPSGTLVASASEDHDVRLWRLSDRQIIAIFQHSSWALCVAFSMDGKHILSGGKDMMISEWEVPDSELCNRPQCMRRRRLVYR
ncbi:WD40-repeat-containing domain protein [Suillus occidentalis]|nr:WD40-repeat-containing domain protein [Suillus occidentalis]